MTDRPELGDTPAGRALAKQPKSKAKPAPAKADNWGAVKKLIKDAATGGGTAVTKSALKSFPDWQKGIRGGK